MVKDILVCYQRKKNYKTDRCKNASCVNGPYNMLRQRHAHACNMSTLHKHANTAGRSYAERWKTWREMKHKMKRCHTLHTKKPNDSSAETNEVWKLTWWHRWNDKGDDGRADEERRNLPPTCKNWQVRPCWQVCALTRALSILTVAFWYTSRALLTVSVLDQELFLTSGPAWSTDFGPPKVKVPPVELEQVEQLPTSLLLREVFRDECPPPSVL